MTIYQKTKYLIILKKKYRSYRYKSNLLVKINQVVVGLPDKKNTQCQAVYTMRSKNILYLHNFILYLHIINSYIHFPIKMQFIIDLKCFLLGGKNIYTFINLY